jgi:hypothetical protein
MLNIAFKLAVCSLRCSGTLYSAERGGLDAREGIERRYLISILSLSLSERGGPDARHPRVQRALDRGRRTLRRRAGEGGRMRVVHACSFGCAGPKRI